MSKQSNKLTGAFLHDTIASFRVWAPFANQVSVTGSFNDWQIQPLEPEGNGHWQGSCAQAAAGMEYKYVIDAGTSRLFRNDPRTMQLHTAAGNSVLSDPDFDWGDDDYCLPLPDELVLYELHIGTFHRPDPSQCGTFQDAIQKLEYLANLGINAVELMPVNTMAMDRGWGYATDYIFAVESLYGGRRGLLEFVRAAHARGIGVIVDVVYNHFGPDTNLDLWQFDGWSENGKGGIYFYNDWRSATPWGDTRPDYGRPEVRQYILDNIRMWLNDCRLDGLRFDSTGYIRNVKGYNNDPGNDLADGWLLLQQATELAKKIKPHSLMVAEDLSGNHHITKSVADGGAGFNAQWEVTFPGVVKDLLSAVNDSDRNFDALCGLLTSNYNHDAFQRVVYSDSHDSAANGSQRLGERIDPGHASSVFARRKSIIAAAIVLSTPGLPMLFQGQEFTEGGSFNDWESLDWDKADVFSGIITAHQHLIDLRVNRHGNTAGLRGQNISIIHRNDNDKLLAYHRWTNGGAGDDTIVLINFSNRPHRDYTIQLPSPGQWRVRFNSDWKGYSPEFNNTLSADFIADGTAGTIAIGPYSVVILSQDVSSSE